MNPNSMTPVDWAKRPMLEKYADFSGRAPRAEYWWYVLAIIILSVVARIIDSILGMNVAGPYGPVSLIVMLGLLVPNIAVSIRRLHDTNRSGWWILLPIVPYCLAFVLGGAAMMGAAAGGSSVGLMAGAGIAGLFLLIGAVCAIVLLVFMVLPGTPGENRYGPNPYGEGAGAVPAE
jgi:uncharacterized membrane protein YhaH (DUF805 family)